MTPQSSSRYIQDGRITRSSSPTWDVKWLRLVVVLAILMAMIVTNPANELGKLIPSQDDATTTTTKRSQGRFWFSMPLSASRDTNFGLFALSRSMDGLSVTALHTTFPLCDFDSLDEDGELLNLLCGWIDDTFCHGKPLLDWNDLPYTVNRLYCCIIVCIILHPFFVGRTSWTRNAKPIHALFSVLARPTIWDLVSTNLIVYPALVSMDRLIRSYLVIDGYMWHFLVAAFVLVIVIGSFCNRLGGAFEREPLGMRAAFAACLGYQRAVSMSSSRLFQFVDIPFSASTLFWLDAGMLFLQGQGPRLVAWIAGGMAGHAFGLLHRQWLAEALRSNAERALQRGLKQILALFG